VHYRAALSEAAASEVEAGAEAERSEIQETLDDSLGYTPIYGGDFFGIGGERGGG